MVVRWEWAPVIERPGYTVYGYGSVLDMDGATKPQTGAVVLKAMSGAELRVLSDVNITFTGYVANTENFEFDADKNTWN